MVWLTLLISATIASIGVAQSKPTEFSLATVLRAFEETSQEALKLVQEISDIEQRSYKICFIMKLLAEAGFPERAYEIAQRIPDLRERSSAFCYLASIAANAKDKLWAKSLLNQSLEVTQGITNELDRSVALSSIARNLAEIGSFNQALKIAEELKDWERNYVLLFIVEKMAETGSFARSFQIAKKISKELQPEAFVYIVAAMAKKGQFNQAFQTVHRIKYERIRSKALYCIAVAMVEKRQFDKAIKISQMITHPVYRFWAIHDIAEAMAKVGDRKKALLLFRQAFKIAKRIDDECAGPQAISSVVGSMARAGFPQEAFKAAKDIKRMIKESEYCAILAEIAKALMKAGKKQQATFVFDQAVKLAQKLTYDRSETLLYIAEKMVETGNMSRVTSLFNQALQHSQKIKSEYQRSSELCDIAKSMLRIGQFEQAFQIAQQIPDRMVRLQTLADLVIEMRKVKTIK